MKHDVDHRDEDHGFAAVGEGFVTLRQPPVSALPREGPFDNPALRQHREAAGLGPLLDFDGPSEPAGGPADEPAGIAAVGEDDVQPSKARTELRDRKLATRAVLDIGRMDHQRQNQTRRVDDEMTLAAADLLPRVVAPRPPFSAVLTLWLSMMPTRGVGFFPTRRRSFWRRAS